MASKTKKAAPPGAKGKKASPLGKGGERTPAGGGGAAAPLATFEDDDMYQEPIKKVWRRCRSSRLLLFSRVAHSSTQPYQYEWSHKHSVHIARFRDHVLQPNTPYFILLLNRCPSSTRAMMNFCNQQPTMVCKQIAIIVEIPMMTSPYFKTHPNEAVQ